LSVTEEEFSIGSPEAISREPSHPRSGRSPSVGRSFAYDALHLLLQEFTEAHLSSSNAHSISFGAWALGLLMAIDLILGGGTNVAVALLCRKRQQEPRRGSHPDRATAAA
jgi:hypothetical protein